MTVSNVRHNYWAILVAALVYFFLGAAWFSFFMEPWMAGIGRTAEWFKSHPPAHPVVPYLLAFVAALGIAVALSWTIQLTGSQTAGRGIQAAFLLWLGFVLTTWATEYAFEERTLQLLAINSGYPLIGMILEGAIIGAWRKK